MSDTERILFDELKSGRSDFSSNVTVEDINLWAGVTVIDIKNSEESWQQYGWKVLEAADQLTMEKPHLAVLISFDGKSGAEFEEDLPDDPTSEERTAVQEVDPTDVILNLQYFFPYCDQAFRDHPELKIILAVICLNDADQQRVRRYLSAVNSVKPRLCIVTAVSKSKTSNCNIKVSPVRYDTKYIGALLPLFCVGKRENVIPGLNSEDQIDDLSVEILSGYDKALCDYQEKQRKKKKTQCPQYNMLLEAGYAAIDGINKLFYGAVPKRKKALEKDVRELEVESQKPAEPAKVEEETETSLVKKKKSLEDVGSELEVRKKHANEFWQAVHDRRTDSKNQKGQSRLQRIPLLAQTLWLCCLYHLLNQGEILDRETLDFQRDPINLILWDAVAYSEGILQLLENCELHSQHNCGYMSVYFHRIGLKQISRIGLAAERRMRIFRRYRVNLADSFEAVSESLYLEFNITDMGRDGAYRAQGIEVRSGKDLLNLFEGKDLEATPQNVAHHYGMPLFYRTVLLKQGRFICATPSDDDHAARLVGRRLAKQQDKGECISVLNRQAWSGYQILLPLTLYAQDDPSDVRCGKELLDSSYLKQEQKHMPSKYNCRIIAKNEVISESMHTSSAQEKIGYAQKICDALSSLISDEESLHTVYALEMMKMGSLDLELYLKGLFLFIAKKQKYRLLFRLLFSDEYALGEAVRRFSIFYGRNGKNPWMGKTQVAFCSAKKEYFPVRLVLAGEEITTARVTAKQYMQYNIDIESGFLLSQIKYLTPSYPRKEKNVPETCPLFPFDLVPFPALKINGAEGDSKKSDFERKISDALKAELQESGCGCKICNAHIRLGSKIHIQDFYDAELLFQSVGNIYRFAYLIAEEILQCIEDSWGESHPLYLIGYENYSSVLVEEIIRLLGKAWPGREKNIWHFQYIKTDDSEEKIIDLSCHSEALAPDTIEVLSPDAIMVTILPIGTTLSTIYKIRNTFFRKYEITLPLERQYNFSLILVRPLQELDALGGASEDNTGLGSGRFWKPGEGQTVVLMPENIPENDSLGKITVRWFFAVETRWMAPDDCDLCNNDMHTQEALDTLQMLPLSQVDKTSTLPTLIFPARRAGIDHGISFSICGEAGENVNRLDEMKGCVEYGHILRDANHYQFYIDYQKYYQNVREGCTEWFADIQQKIDHDAFNIIISPLQPDNCRFIKDAIDHLFLHSLRFIYIPLHQVYREEIRSRFSYIAKEYQDACVGSILPKYHVYYIDYTIVSGESLHRSRTLIQMLLNDVIPRIQVGFFEKIILLTNRSSFDTAATFVRDPKTDFLAYSTLCIPSYNTLRNRCPACEMVETYQTIAKCSATNELFWHYFDLAQKHKLLSLDDHRRSLERIHFSKSNYLSYFYQSLVLDLDREFTREKEIDFIEFKRDFKEDIDTVSSKCPKRLTLGEVLATVSEKNKAAIYSYYKALIAGRNWRRLICTHEAVSMADRLLNNGAEAKTAVEIGVEMLDTISARLLSCQDASPFEKREWLISYIKTFSREYPSKIAPIRAAAYILLELFFLELISKPSQPDDSQEQLIKNMPDLQQYPTVTALLHITEGVSSDADIAAADRLQIYQLYLVLGKRLCDLQSNLLLRYTTLMQVDAFLVDLRYGQQESLISSHSYSKLLELPKSDRLQSDYLYMIKWAAMSSSEEAKAFLLQELVKRVSKAANSTESSNQMGLEDQHDSHPLINANFAEVIRQENTRVLYTGIKRLHEVVKYEVFNWGDLVAKVEGVMHCSGWSEEHNYQPMYQNPLCDLFKYLEEDLNLYHGGDTSLSSASQILAALLTFYRLMEKLENKSERETAKDYIDVYNQACFILSKLGNYRNCCLIHKTNGENVVIAQYLTDCVENLSEELQRILNDSTTIKQLEEGTLYNTVARYKSENGCVSAMVLAFRIKQGSDITYQQKVYAVLFSMETKNCEGDVLRDAQADRSHYLLFMRQQFQASLERDLYALHHFMLSRDDVGIIWPDEKDNSSKSVTTPEDAANPEGSVASEEAVASKESTDSKGAETPLCVLHLSDLHVSKENKDAILDLITSNVAELKKLNPQLLLITGDIVQGTGSAVDLEENYKCAGHVIRRIAEVLWTTTGLTGDQKTLHGDWKKRIIIIPGNHDYSSMNELVASSTLRVTKLGIPTQRPGSPMSRYAYYIQFLQNFLDIDSRQTIQNNLKRGRRISRERFYASIYRA